MYFLWSEKKRAGLRTVSISIQSNSWVREKDTFAPRKTRLGSDLVLAEKQNIAFKSVHTVPANRTTTSPAGEQLMLEGEWWSV